VELEPGDRTYTKPLLKDWILTTEEFASQAREIIRDMMFDHDNRHKNRTQAKRADYIQDRQIKEYEGELDIVGKEEGIVDAHVLMIIINRLTTLHRRVQVEI
jgi:histidyl-tRNA synthetase